MGFLLRIFQTTLRQRMRFVRNWIILLLIPCLVLTVHLAIPESQVTAPVQVGVSLPQTGGEEMMALLEQRSGTVLTFIEADPDTIDKKIAAGHWDCGILLPEDFSDRLEQLDTHRIFTIRIGAGSRVYPLVEETLASCLAVLVTGPMAEDYLTDSSIYFREDMVWQGLDEQHRVVISMTTPNGDPLEPLQIGTQGIQNLLCWLISAAVLVWLLLCAYDLGRWCRSEAARSLLMRRPALTVMWGRMAADWLLIALCGCCSMFLIGMDLAGAFAVIVYSLFWAAAGVLMAHFGWLWKALPIAPPYAVVMSLLLSGLLFDPVKLFPPLDWLLARLPCAAFLQICQGNRMASVTLILLAALFLLVSAIPLRQENR